MTNRLPSFTLSQELQSGILTYADGTIQNIAAGDTAVLSAIGVKIETTSSQATLKVDVNNRAYSKSTLALVIKDTVIGETTWFDITEVNLKLIGPDFGFVSDPYF